MFSSKFINFFVLLLIVWPFRSDANSSQTMVPERASVGEAVNSFKYCLHSDYKKALGDDKCRTIYITQGATGEYLGIYERFEKFSLEGSFKKKTVDSVTYFKGAEPLKNYDKPVGTALEKLDKTVVFDQNLDLNNQHLVDLAYPENNQVQIFLVNGLPRYQNIVLARNEDAKSLSYFRGAIVYYPEYARVFGDFYLYSKDANGEIIDNPKKTEVHETYVRVY